MVSKHIARGTFVSEKLQFSCILKKKLAIYVLYLHGSVQMRNENYTQNNFNLDNGHTSC